MRPRCVGRARRGDPQSADDRIGRDVALCAIQPAVYRVEYADAAREEAESDLRLAVHLDSGIDRAEVDR